MDHAAGHRQRPVPNSRRTNPCEGGLDQKDGVFDVEIRLAVVRKVIVLVKRQPAGMCDEKRVREGPDKHPPRVRFL